jgi:adenylate cyclase
VIGRAKFAYDLWGDTVNTASRMESHAPAGTIQVTQRVYERLHPAYDLRSRGAIDVKGKGPMPAYLLTGRRGEHAVPPSATLEGSAALSRAAEPHEEPAVPKSSG